VLFRSIAGLGFQGSVRKVGGRVLPQYFVMLGGGVDDEGAHFGRTAARIPARRVPEAVERLIALYGAEKRVTETPAAFFRRLSPERAKALLGDLEEAKEQDLRPEDFVDLAEDHAFAVETMAGECAT